MRPSGFIERPDYRVDLLRRRNRVTVHAGAALVATSERTLLVDEQGHGLVFYFPPEAIVAGTLVAAATPRSFCPYKGEADYFALAGGDGQAVAWCYATPYAEVAGIAGYIAFYQDRVRLTVGG
ncbi:hypothetical protein IP88_05405 [alpha proteobacterium AAP81b]|nr:hypothetical protein IP88_05405 [alpha proteobacterium AAP81b]